MNHAFGVGSIARPVGQYSITLPLCHGCPRPDQSDPAVISICVNSENSHAHLWFTPYCGKCSYTYCNANSILFLLLRTIIFANTQRNTTKKNYKEFFLKHSLQGGNKVHIIKFLLICMRYSSTAMSKMFLRAECLLPAYLPYLLYPLVQGDQIMQCPV